MAQSKSDLLQMRGTVSVPGSWGNDMYKGRHSGDISEGDGDGNRNVRYFQGYARKGQLITSCFPSHHLDTCIMRIRERMVHKVHQNFCMI